MNSKNGLKLEGGRGRGLSFASEEGHYKDDGDVSYFEIIRILILVLV